jgi:hypothetical protein
VDHLVHGVAHLHFDLFASPDHSHFLPPQLPQQIQRGLRLLSKR